MHMPLLLKLAIAGLLLLSLAGCVEMKYHLTVNSNGSADVKYHIAFEESMLSLGQMSGQSSQDMLSKWKADLQKEGYTVTDYAGDGKVGVDATRHLRKVEEVKNLNRFFQQEKDDSADLPAPFIVKHNLFTDVYTVNTAVDLRSFNSDGAGEIGNAMQAAMLSQIKTAFVLTLPVKPRKHNATNVSNDGKTLEWTLAPGKNNEITLDTMVPNLRNIIIAGVLAIIMLVVLAGALRRRGL